MLTPRFLQHCLRVIAVLSTISPLFAIAQSVPSSDAKAADAAKVAETPRLTQLRDDFVKATTTSGLPCAIAPPTLIVEHTPSYGNYDPDTNSLHTPVWEQLEPNERGIFFRMADAANHKEGSDEAAARREFEIGVHHWVFVHELGHWWQGCRKVNDNRKPYQIEYEADRIAAAYWHKYDPTVADHMEAGFKFILAHAHSPVPAGQETMKYFNDNYQQLGPTPAYIWFQTQMCVAMFAEKPAPCFLQALQETGHP
jgi:hypothetical protein